MESYQAELIVESWRDGAGVVSRGPRWLLGYGPVDPEEVVAHCGSRRRLSDELWRVQMGGRFLASDGLIYPGGVPFPEDVAGSTVVVASEVWLYFDLEAGRVLGSHWWPEAVRRPVASIPGNDFPGAIEFGDMDLPVPRHKSFDPILAAREIDGWVVLLAEGHLGDPLNEMVWLQQGALSFRVSRGTVDADEILYRFHPPYESYELNGGQAVGRHPGKALGPQTWPWPGELIWASDGLRYELKGQVEVGRLLEVAATVDGSY